MEWQPIETAPKDGSTILVISYDYDDGKWWAPEFAWWNVALGKWGSGFGYDSWPLTHWHPIGKLPDHPT